MRGCGKLWFINCEIHRVWESGDINTGFQQGVENGVDNLHLPKITALEKAVGNFRERLQSFFSLLFQSTSPCNISIHVPTVVREEERTSPFQINYIDCGRRLLWTNIVSSAEVRTNEQARSDASNACPLHLLCKCGVPARGGVRLIWYTAVFAHLNRPVARVRIKRSSGA